MGRQWLEHDEDWGPYVLFYRTKNGRSHRLPIGPMALEATCRPQGDQTLLHVRQSGYDKSSPRWTRYYDIVSAGWIPALNSLKKYLEDRWAS